MMDSFGYGHSWGMGGGMWLLSVLFWGLVVLGIFFLAKGLFSQNPSKSSSTTNTNETPLTVLKKRYANGEIDQDTFNRMKNDLEG